MKKVCSLNLPGELTKTAELEAILNARTTQPHSILGMHVMSLENETKAVVVRCFIQNALKCEVVSSRDSGEVFSLNQITQEGFFEGLIESHTETFPYTLRVQKTDGKIDTFADPYSFLPTISEEEIFLFNQGTAHHAYRFLGVHQRIVNGIRGFSFAVWAPDAKRVSLVGDFNYWDGRYFPMRTIGSSGVWEIFVPGMKAGGKYKYELIDANENLVLKSDPYATYFESPPNNASIVWDVSDFQWNDHDWIQKRSKQNVRKIPMSVYEVHMGSWQRDENNKVLSYREIATKLVSYVKQTGFTHVEFLPLAEHPFDGSWGYQVTGFFAPTHRHGSPQDFMYLVDVLHQNNIGIIIDWVPGHFPKDDFALAKFDGTCLYEHEDPRKGEHQDWGTLIFNYGRNEVKNFLIGSVISWFDRFHIDGVRVDAVASMLYLDYSRKSGEWIPNAFGGKENIEAIEFLRTTNDLIHSYYPGSITIAEESTSFGRVSHSTQDFGLGFDFKWNMGWMHDTLEYFKKDPICRKFHHNQLTFAMLYQYSEHFVSAFSHDEVVHGKGSLLMKMGSWNMPDKTSTLRALYGYMWTWPGKKTLFMGCEFGQTREWAYDSSLDWELLKHIDHSGIRQLICDLNRLYKELRFWPEKDNERDGFQWVNPDDGDNSVLTYLRLGNNPEETLLIVCNFTPMVRTKYLVGVPFAGFWQERINTNASEYGGTGLGNSGGIKSQTFPWNNRPFSLELTIPPLSTSIFQYTLS